MNSNVKNEKHNHYGKISARKREFQEALDLALDAMKDVRGKEDTASAYDFESDLHHDLVIAQVRIQEIIKEKGIKSRKKFTLALSNEMQRRGWGKCHMARSMNSPRVRPSED